MPPQKQRFSIVQLIFVVIAVALVTLFLLRFLDMGRFTEKRDIARGVSNCRQIIASLRIYASERDGGGHTNRNQNAGPETANEFFRVLFREETINDESIFGCPHSPFVPDGKFGNDPDFNDALAPGENHWMVTKGLSDSAPGSIPLVYENAAVAMWNPEWNADAKHKPVPGRTWSSGIIVGMNDNSVTIQRLAAEQGAEVPLKNLPGSDKNLFTQHDSEDGSENFEVLDIEQ